MEMRRHAPSLPRSERGPAVLGIGCAQIVQLYADLQAAALCANCRAERIRRIRGIHPKWTEISLIGLCAQNHMKRVIQRAFRLEHDDRRQLGSTPLTQIGRSPMDPKLATPYGSVTLPCYTTITQRTLSARMYRPSQEMIAAAAGLNVESGSARPTHPVTRTFIRAYASRNCR